MSYDQTSGLIVIAILATACALFVTLMLTTSLRRLARSVQVESKPSGYDQLATSLVEIERVRASLEEALAKAAVPNPDDVSTLERLLEYARDRRIAELTARLDEDSRLFAKFGEVLSALEDLRRATPDDLIAERDQLKVAVTDCEKRLADADQRLRAVFGGIEKMGALLADRVTNRFG